MPRLIIKPQKQKKPNSKIYISLSLKDNVNQRAIVW